MTHLQLPSGARMPKYGMGTWFLGERASRRAAEVAALVAGLDAGAQMIDTAEMYASGAAEEVTGEAIRGRRDEVFVVSKVLPGNAAHADTLRACEASLQRLGTDRVDLYLYHWPGGVAFEETLRALTDLKQQGKVIDIGVSNFDVADLQAWRALDADRHTAVNQVYFNLRVRAAQWGVIPWCREHGVAIQAYTPLDQGGALLQNAVLRAVAARLGATPAQVALAWLYAQPGVVPLPRSASVEHARENVAAMSHTLAAADIAELDAEFPPPTAPTHLPML